MAIRKVVKFGTKSLREKSVEVHKVSKKISTLIKDMIDTMYASNGVGLAAPQVGENLRIFVLDVSSPEEGFHPQVFVNPKIIKKSGAIISNEGCLSFNPQNTVDVRRYENVTVKALNEKGKAFVLEAKGGTLLARCIQHEFDHLDGILFVDHSIDRENTNEVLQKDGFSPLDMESFIDEPELDEILNNKNVKE